MSRLLSWYTYLPQYGSAHVLPPPKPPPPGESTTPPEQGERTYLFLCLVSLLLLLAVLLERGERERALIPVLLGLVGLMLRWRITPVFLLISLGVVVILNVSDRLAWLRRLTASPGLE